MQQLSQEVSELTAVFVGKTASADPDQVNWCKIDKHRIDKVLIIRVAAPTA